MNDEMMISCRYDDANHNSNKMIDLENGRLCDLVVLCSSFCLFSALDFRKQKSNAFLFIGIGLQMGQDEQGCAGYRCE